ncbi:MAG: hypothetical protein JXL80_10235 [Planctomycetes bacterium]|nr:hypothetical protein [Planctomycetota bacterium]
MITFNYDSLVELALTRLNRPWNHGMQDSANGGTTVLKMHGSLDWVICERDGTFPTMNLVKLFSKRNVNFEHSQTVRHKDDPEFRWELWRVPGASALAKINRCDSWLGVAGLDRIKKLHDLPGSGMTWDKAGDAVRDAEEVYIVGFSFSQYDLMARLLVVDALAARGKALDRAVVVDPCACRLADDLKPLFGIKPFAVESKAEEVNWPDLLHAQ